MDRGLVDVIGFRSVSQELVGSHPSSRRVSESSVKGFDCDWI